MTAYITRLRYGIALSPSADFGCSGDVGPVARIDWPRNNTPPLQIFWPEDAEYWELDAVLAKFESKPENLERRRIFWAITYLAHQVENSSD